MASAQTRDRDKSNRLGEPDADSEVSLNIFSPSEAWAERGAGADELDEPEDPHPDRIGRAEKAIANNKSDFLTMGCNRRAAIPNKSTNANNFQQIKTFCKL